MRMIPSQNQLPDAGVGPLFDLSLVDGGDDGEMQALFVVVLNGS